MKALVEGALPRGSATAIVRRVFNEAGMLPTDYIAKERARKVAHMAAAFAAVDVAFRNLGAAAATHAENIARAFGPPR